MYLEVSEAMVARDLLDPVAQIRCQHAIEPSGDLAAGWTVPRKTEKLGLGTLREARRSEENMEMERERRRGVEKGD